MPFKGNTAHVVFILVDFFALSVYSICKFDFTSSFVIVTAEYSIGLGSREGFVTVSFAIIVGQLPTNHHGSLSRESSRRQTCRQTYIHTYIHTDRMNEQFRSGIRVIVDCLHGHRGSLNMLAIPNGEIAKVLFVRDTTYA